MESKRTLIETASYFYNLHRTYFDSYANARYSVRTKDKRSHLLPAEQFVSKLTQGAILGVGLN